MSGPSGTQHTRMWPLLDVVWLADQNAPRCRVIRDVRTFPSYPASVAKPLQRRIKLLTQIPAKVLHGDVR